MGRRDELSNAVLLLRAAQLSLSGAINLVGAPIPKGIPSAGLRASIDRARDSVAGAVRDCEDELRYLERLDGAEPARLPPPETEPLRPLDSAEGLT